MSRRVSRIHRGLVFVRRGHMRRGVMLRHRVSGDMGAVSRSMGDGGYDVGNAVERATMLP